MNISISFIRAFFTALCILLATSYSAMAVNGGLTVANVAIGMTGGAAFSLLLIGADVLFKKWNLYSFNTVFLGLICGYLMGEAVMLTFNAVFNINALTITNTAMVLTNIAVFLSCAYFGVVLAVRASEELSITIPFIKFKNTSSKKKDILIDWTILQDARIIELASSGLLDDALIAPRFMFKELYAMLDDSDETIKNKGRRCLETFKKLESLPTLNLRYSDIDFLDIADHNLKLLQLAGSLDANILTADPTRLQQYAVEDVRIIHMHLLSNAIKPVSGEQLMIKVQRYGKEPRQGVGYLDDGTMVVVNGGAEYIGDTIKAVVLSIKHTASGRMIFCNAAEESSEVDSVLSHVAIDLEQQPQKNYFSV